MTVECRTHFSDHIIHGPPLACAPLRDAGYLAVQV